jgi:predicted transcriptional regulator
LEEVITLRLEKGVYAKLQKIAKKECVFASMLIRKAVMDIIAEKGKDL